MAIDIFIVSCACILLSAPLVHLIVPPKTPVLSGFGTAAVGSYRELVCDASQPDAGTITYKWYKYSVKYGVENWEHKGPIGTSQKYIFNPVTEKKVFHGVTEEYVKGKYKCRASNSAGTRDSEWGDLFFYKPCSLYNVSVSPPKPAPGSTFILNCYIPNPKAPPGTPQVTGFPSGQVIAGAQLNLKCVAWPPGDTYDWYKDGTKVTTSLTYDFQVTKESAGVYKCVARNGVVSASSTDKTLVVYYKPDSVVVSSRKTSSHVGEKDNFTCTVSGGNPTPTVKIYLKRSGGALVEVTQGQDRVMAKEDNQAEYYCEAKVTGYPPFDMTSSRKTYTVTYKPDSVVVSSRKTSSHVGEKDNFTCTVSGGNPTPTVKIYLKRSGGALVEVTQGQDRVMAKEDNQAEYYCEAKVTGYPVLDMTSSRKTYTVTYKPDSVVVSSGKTSSHVGEKDNFTCTVSGGNPTPTVKIYLKRSGGALVEVTQGQDRVMAKEDNQAEYYCEAKVTGYPVLDMTSSRKTYNVTFNPSKITLLRKPPTVIDEGKLITIICETNSANPVANVTFHRKRKGGTWEQLTSGITSEDRAAEYNGRIRKSTLVVTANRLVTQAVFKCEVRDGLFQMEQTTTVKVYSVPTFTITRNGRLVTVVFVPQIREYTSFQLKFCGPSQTPKTSGCGGVRFTIHDPTTSTYRVIVTHETTIYVFYMDLYIGDDVVYSSGQVHPEQAVPAGSSPDGGMIAGVVVAVVILVAMVVVVVVVLHGRSMACFAGRNKPEESNQDAERTGTTKPVSVCDQPPYKDVVYSALEGEDTQPEPVYLNYPQQDSVKEVIYDNPKVIEKPSGEDTPRKVEDMSVHDFKQWLLSNRVTESTYECLSRNGFNYQGFFFMLQQQDLDKMKIEPLAQEALIRKLVRDFNGIRQSESCEGKKPRCPTAGEDNPYVEMENQNGAFYILPDVTANQTYMASRVSNN
ncbi:uncharacterized protein LOC135496899 isoform X2 [Lineus longissimus]|uniref:uncharacterized protein LOC135496899 isoform X2 n=1 Tax=Lineus longissimus TaxID=88925 RepID=UPI00315DC964